MLAFLILLIIRIAFICSVNNISIAQTHGSFLQVSFYQEYFGTLLHLAFHLFESKISQLNLSPSKDNTWIFRGSAQAVLLCSSATTEKLPLKKGFITKYVTSFPFCLSGRILPHRKTNFSYPSRAEAVRICYWSLSYVVLITSLTPENI